MELSGRQLEQVWEALVDAFTYAELKRLLLFRLDKKRLEQIAPEKSDLADVCLLLIEVAEREGWLIRLIQVIVRSKPDNEKLKRLIPDLHLETKSNDSVGDPVIQSPEISDPLATEDPGKGLGSISADRLQTPGEYEQELTRGQPFETESNGSVDEPTAQRPLETSDPLLVAEDFRKDLEKIPADRWWSPGECEEELTGLRLWLPKLRKHACGVSPRRTADLGQSVLRELQLEDEIECVLAIINDFEVCLSCLLDPSSPQSTPDITKCIQWFRQTSGNLSDRIGRLEQLGRYGTEPSSEQGTPTSYSDHSLFHIDRSLRSTQAGDKTSMEERWGMLAEGLGVGVCLDAVVTYLKDTSEPSGSNVKKLRRFLASLSGFIEHTTLAQKRLPSARAGPPFYPLGEAAKLQKSCDDATDSLDVYGKYRGWLSRWEDAGLRGTSVPVDPHDLYGARRSLIEKLIILRRRIPHPGRAEGS